MKDHVLVIDDSFRRNVCHVVTQKEADEHFAQTGEKIWPGIWAVQDKHRRQVVETVQVKIPYVGRCLEHAVRRAKRWIRANGMIPKPPKHIILAMMAFSKADPDGFKAAVKHVGA